MKFFGAHVSIAGGVENAPLNAAALGATAFAMFTKNQRQWHAPALSAASIAAFRANCAAAGFAANQILPHDSYLINLGQPDTVKFRAAVAAFQDEFTRCQELALDRLNFHPGSHLNQIPMDDCLKRIASGVREALAESAGVMAVIENTAGQGSNVGFELEQLARLIELLDASPRVGVCIDTCHAFASGYDLRDEEAYTAFWDRFAALIGFDRLAGMHLNDAKAPLASHLDRHESLGSGTLGWPLFERIARDRRLEGIPLILETPDETRWAAEIAHLQATALDAEKAAR